MAPDQEKACHEALKHSLDTGYLVLASGGECNMKPVIAAIGVKGGSFNARQGSVFTYSGKVPVRADEPWR